MASVPLKRQLPLSPEDFDFRDIADSLDGDAPRSHRGAVNRKPQRPRLGDCTAVYDFPDERGRVCLRKRRHELSGWPKTFRFMARRKPDNVWVPPSVLMRNYEGAHAYFHSLLYNLPELLEAGPWDDLAVVEGEKDAYNLTAAGLPALSHWQGGTGWTLGQAARWAGFRGGVTVVADRDASGARCALQTRSLLLGVGIAPSRLRVVLAAQGKDASDHLAAGHSPDDFVLADLDALAALAATAPPPGRGGAYRAGRAL